MIKTREFTIFAGVLEGLHCGPWGEHYWPGKSFCFPERAKSKLLNLLFPFSLFFLRSLSAFRIVIEKHLEMLTNVLFNDTSSLVFH